MRARLLVALGVLWLQAALASAQGTASSPHGELQLDCAECHTPERWVPVTKPPAFHHEKTGFPLEASHAKAACRSCHRSLLFNRVGTACIDCHKDVHRGELGRRCETCHTPKTWSNQREMFQVHSRTRFPLFAVHANLDCEACHKNQKPSEFASTPSDCGTCHGPSFEQARNPNHVLAGFARRCEDCHGVASSNWHQTTFRHPASYPLRGAHATARCAACHATAFKGTARECFACHKADYESTRQPDHLRAGLPTQCETCHRVSAWRPATFQDHSRTRFPLTGAHQRAQCASCHAGGRYTGTPTDCLGCHEDDFRRPTNPNHAGFPTGCLACHSTAAWRPATGVDHDKTRFPLTGAHQRAQCTLCHKNGRYTGTPMDCYTCHQADYGRTANPNHVAGNFPKECRNCHQTAAWRPATGVDHSRTRFPLTGAHQRVECARCHVGGKYAGTPLDCFACHRSAYAATTNPNHVAAGFPTQCQGCHTSAAWRPATGIDHSKTRFPLTGLHVQVECSRCHVGGKYTGTPSDCYSCHQAAYAATTNPNHVAANFPRECQTCHQTSGWRPATGFDHAKTRFPLTGLHQQAQCAQCHVGGKYAGTPSDCYSCHQADYSRTTNPNHVTGNFPKQCQSCHQTTGWRPASGVDHNKTRFPLTGAHQQAQCARCHVGGQYSGTPTDCYSCHQTKYAQTTNPNHAAAGYPTTCQSCHQTSAWRPAAGVDHSKTRFPLTGAHQAVQCTRCHVGGKYAGTPTDCYSCHQAKYAQTTNPNHAAAGFPTTCQSCHATVAWRPATFDHAKTAFPLTGSHQRADCGSCHKNGRYAGTPKDCYSCHQAKYAATTNPNHAAAGFPTTCQQCHQTSAWRPATFDHARTAFPLTGAHQATNCAACHKNGRYAGTPKDCFSCHQAKYAQTTNPNHAAASFPTTCQSCHATSAWRPATFDHARTAFPLTGAHQRADCGLCHKNGRYAGTPKDCFSCHQASYNSTTNPNHAAAGFPKECQSCHQTSAWRPATFDHARTAFPLTGAHQRTDCGLCHKNGRYAGTPKDCFSCHQAAYNSTTNPNHAAAGFPSQCQNCHQTSAWRPASFDHDARYFPIYSGKHKGKWKACSDCHVSASNYRAFECIVCHAHNDKTKLDSKHREVAGYTFQSAACYRCHPQGTH